MNLIFYVDKNYLLLQDSGTVRTGWTDGFRFSESWLD
jgi:hypothetical protein